MVLPGCDRPPDIGAEPTELRGAEAHDPERQSRGLQRPAWMPPDGRVQQLLESHPVELKQILAQDGEGPKFHRDPAKLKRPRSQPSQERINEATLKPEHVARSKRKPFKTQDGDRKGTPLASRTSVQPDHPASAPAAPSEGSKSPSTLASSVRVKRLLVTDRVEHREPVASDRLVADGTPLIAFVEVENRGAEPAELEVVFVHSSGRKVGFVTLEIPANRRRWRTWARTRRITLAGDWTAKVRFVGGKQLAATAFSAAAAD